jgi:hypothetical protein
VGSFATLMRNDDFGGGMANLRKGLIRAAFEALYFSGAHPLLSPFCRGVGAVFMTRGAVLHLRAVELSGPARQAVVAHARAAIANTQSLTFVLW